MQRFSRNIFSYLKVTRKEREKKHSRKMAMESNRAQPHCLTHLSYCVSNDRRLFLLVLLSVLLLLFCHIQSDIFTALSHSVGTHIWCNSHFTSHLSSWYKLINCLIVYDCLSCFSFNSNSTTLFIPIYKINYLTLFCV